MCFDPSVVILNLLDEDSDEENEAKETENSESDASSKLIAIAAKAISLSFMLSLSQRKIEYVIGCQLKWLVTYGFFNHHQGEWIWALLVALQKPLEPSTESDLRSICKFFIQFKHDFFSTACKPKQATDDNNTDLNNTEETIFDHLNEEQLTDFSSTINLFIYIIGSYFDQKDLISTV